ncbi:MAG TPA: hypothetical protein VGF59_22625 [Bryobacteraceae bacterium]|jgi:hypothetical protein
MTSKYSKLRIERWKNRASAAVAGVAVLSVAENASAAPATLPLNITAGGAKWFLSNSTSATGGSGGLGITDATLLSPSRSDAYDGAFCIIVNGIQFQDPTGTVDLTGTTLTSNTQVISGLNVSEQYFFDTATPTVRLLVSFQNPTASPISATVLWGNNLGSDNGTTVFTSSSGDTVVTPADRWFISWDGNPTGDPVLSFVAFGSGASVTPSATPRPPGPNAGLFTDQFNINVPAGQTRRLMLFGRLSTSTASAQSSITTFNSTANLQSAGLLAGLTPQQESEIVNWAFGSAPGPVPISGTFNLLVLGLLFLAAGAKAKSWLAAFRQP